LRAHQSVAHQPAPMAPAALCIVSSCNFARHAVVDSRCPGCRWSAPWVGRASPLENGQREDSVRTAQPHNLHATNRVFLPFDDPALDAENGGSWGAQQNCLHLCRPAPRMGIDDRDTTPPAVRKLVVFVGCAVRAMLVFVRRRRLPQRRSRLPSSCQRMPARFSVVSI
jgi:hypothetical protein